MNTLQSRFFAKITKRESGCWIWIGACARNGYGKIGAGGRRGATLYAHRVSYEIHKGVVPPGLDLDHICRVRNCVNPDHLEAVTRQENLRRGIGNGGVLHTARA